MSGFPRPRKVPPTPLSELAALLGAAGPAAGPADMVGASGSESVTGVTHASSEVRSGDLYAALPGRRHHGAEFLPEALAAGAAAVLTDAAGAAAVLTDAAGARVAGQPAVPVLVVPDPRAALGVVADRVYGQPTRELTVIGVTGTSGKTSTVYLLAAGLRAGGLVPGVIGTVETRLGGLVVDSPRTTPEATDLHALLAVARQEGIEAVAMEVSSHALALGRVEGVRFAVGGFTNLGVDHLDFHADLEDYFAAKARLFDGRCGTEIVNVDDPAGRRLVREHTLTYSPSGDPTATWYPSDVTESGYHQRFLAHGPGGLTIEAGVALPGRHNVANALLAVAALTAVGVDPAVAGRAVADCPGAPGRMERVGEPGGVLGVVDYAHKPDAVVEVLAALRRSVAAGRGRIVCVIGAGGDRDHGKRPLMGAAAARGADLVIVTDDNPRTEDPAAIRAEVLRGAREVAGATVLEVAGRREAIEAAVSRAQPGDVVAVLGKGHERGQETAGQVAPFDDRVELAAVLRSRPAGAGGAAGNEPRVVEPS